MVWLPTQSCIHSLLTRPEMRYLFCLPLFISLLLLELSRDLSSLEEAIGVVDGVLLSAEREILLGCSQKTDVAFSSVSNRFSFFFSTVHLFPRETTLNFYLKKKNTAPTISCIWGEEESLWKPFIRKSFMKCKHFWCKERFSELHNELCQPLPLPVIKLVH